MYSLLTSKLEKLFYMDKWEQDIGETFEVDEWFKKPQYASKSYINTSLIQANYKVLPRWFMVPVRVEVSPGGFPLVFRGMWHGRHSVPHMVATAQKSNDFGFAFKTLYIH